MTEKYFTVLKKCSLFNGIPEKYYIEVLKYIRAVKRAFKKGEIILHIGDKFNHAGLVLDGIIECSFHDANFNKCNMNHFSVGNLFGEAMACSEVLQSPMQISAVTDCVILFLDYRVLYELDNKNKYHSQISINLIRIFSMQNLFLNQKVRILSQKELRNKILMYIQSLRPDKNGVRKLPFSKTAWAEFLCVNRTALSREISRMSKEKIFSMDGRNFILNSEQ